MQFVTAEINKWFMAPARLGLWLFGPGPRIWWHLFDESKTSAVAGVIVQSFATLLMALAARFLGEVSYGHLAALNTLIGWFGVIAVYPTASLMPRFVAEGRLEDTPHERKSATGLLLGLGIGLVAMLIGLAFVPLGLDYYHVPDLRRAGLILCVFFPLTVPPGFCLYLLQCSGRLKLWAGLNLFFGIVPITAVSLAALLFKPLNVDTYILALGAANLVNATAGLAISVRLLGTRNVLRPDTAVAGRLIQAGFGGWVASVACNVGLVGVGTMIVRQIGSTALGHYQLVTGIGGWVFAVVMSVAVPKLSVWSERAAQGHFQSLRRSLRLFQSGTGALSTLLTLAALFLAPRILEGFYGAGYRADAPLLQLHAISWIALGFGCWYWIVLAALGHPGRVMYSNLAWSGVQLAGCWLAVCYLGLGILGAMAAYVLAYFAWLLGYELTFRRTLRAEAARNPSNNP